MFREQASSSSIEVDGLAYGLVIEHITEYQNGQSNIRDLLRVQCVTLTERERMNF